MNSARRALRILAPALVAGLFYQACSPMKHDDESPTEGSSFQASATADPIPVAAEIATDLTGMVAQPNYKNLKPPAVDKNPEKTEKADSEQAKTETPKSDRAPASEGKAQAKENSASGKSSDRQIASHFGKGSRTVKYTVKSGDTLMKIAFQYFGNLYRWREIYQDNKSRIVNANRLSKGTVLTVHVTGPVTVERNGDPYLIHRNDTLAKISLWVYGKTSKWKKLWANNRQLIHDPHWIFAGFHLYYTMTEQERKDAERLKHPPQIAPVPLAQAQPGAPASAPADRGVASVPNAPKEPGNSAN